VQAQSKPEVYKHSAGWLGLIDIHVHVYAGTGERGSFAGDNSVYPDGFTFRVGVIRRKSFWGIYAALPIFVFWLFIMTLIWLFLLGMASAVRGHFTVVEIILRLLIGASSI
jgi:hypothetical protein